MLCPKCNERMMPYVYLRVEVDQCTHCFGIWIDKGELDLILAKGMGKIFDESLGFEQLPDYDEIPGHCRRCDKAMMVLTGADDIRFEWCERCESIFLDSGELTKLGRMVKVQLGRRRRHL